MKKKFNVKRFILFIIIFLLVIFSACIGYFSFLMSPVSKDDTKIIFEVDENDTFISISNKLIEKELIRNELAYKVYVKLSSTGTLEVGKYELDKSMSLKEILDILGNGQDNRLSNISITIPEGKHITDIAEIASKVTTTTKESYINYWNSDEFVDKVIDKYWFVTKDVKREGIFNPLEGYFFPSTYELEDKQITPEYLAYKLLDQMDIVLTKYKNGIDKSELSIHELVTMASIVEAEAVLDEDRANIAGVFYNRLEDDYYLESCATRDFYDEDSLDSLYNTYRNLGLPIGPGNCPSEKSIKAAIYPSNNDYYYFMADVCSNDPKTYFSKTYYEHEQKVNKYLTCEY